MDIIIAVKAFYYNNDFNTLKMGIAASLKSVFGGKKPIICCIGTDAVIGDSLGPLVGTLLKEKLLGKTYVYGTLNMPITAKDIDKLSDYLGKIHKSSPVLAIDAALGAENEIGYIKISDTPIKPGLGVEKKLSEIGSASIIAIVEEKNSKNMLSFVRISTVYALAQVICAGIVEYFDEIEDLRSKGEENARISL